MIEHPFIGSLADKSSEDLLKTINDLYGKQGVAYRMGKVDIAQQIGMMLNSYRAEYQKRIAAENQKHLERLAKDKIKIGK